MFNGTNPSGKEFEVLDEDDDLLGSFDYIADAAACASKAPFWSGLCSIRRDLAISDVRHSGSTREATSERWFNFLVATCDHG